MLLPGFNLMMLGFESASVIQKHLTKIARGGSQSTDEIQLMFAEKTKASQEAMVMLMGGGTAMATFTRFRGYVAANEVRLSAAN